MCSCIGTFIVLIKYRLLFIIKGTINCTLMMKLCSKMIALSNGIFTPSSLVIRILISFNTVFVTLVCIVNMRFMDYICFMGIISKKWTIYSPKYDGVMISQYTCLQSICRENRGRKLDWGWSKFVDIGKALDKVFKHSCDTCILSKTDQKYGLESPIMFVHFIFKFPKY